LGSYLLQGEIEFIGRSLKDTALSGTLLDLCCGGGDVSLLLYRPGLRIVGLDVNRLPLAAFRQRSHDVPLVQGDCLCLPFASSSLGCIAAIHCFDHLDRVQFLHECRRLLGPAGLLIFDSLNRHSYKLALKRLRRRTSIRSRSGPLDKYVDVFSWNEVLQAIAAAGFDVQAASGYGWIPFGVNSESKLVNPAAWVEQVLRLDRFPSVSPRVLVAARKRVDRRKRANAHST
jgi:ubiquinone/menaquinone biosynthesis C-methylase UbiE